MRNSKLRRQLEQEHRHKRFWPGYEDFMKFLEDNPRRKFDMEDPHSCVGACYADMEISETFMGPPWFCEFQRKVCRGVWLGQDLLVELRRVRPPIIEGHTRPRR